MNQSIKITTKLTKQYIVIMAGGSGTRMKSELPKQLLDVGNDPMLVHLLKHGSNLYKDVVLIVSNKNRESIINTLTDRKYITYVSENLYRFMDIDVHICVQPVANGTGGALMATQELFSNNGPDDQILVLSADVPLVAEKTIVRMFQELDDSSVAGAVLAKDTVDNFGYGRVVMSDDQFIGIVEQRDCNDAESMITLINTGIYGFKSRFLLESLKSLDQNNSQKEYYLTDCPKIIKQKMSGMIKVVKTHDYGYDETLGANSPDQLKVLRDEYTKKFTIESIGDTMTNLSDDNLRNLIRVLGQLTKVSAIDIPKLRKQLVDGHENKYNKMHIQVVKYEDRVIGTGSVLVENKIIHGMGKVAHVEDIVIDKEFRGLGLAKKLILRLIQIARDNECYKIILDASDDVAGIYEKFGFKKHANNMRLDLN